MFTVPLDGIYFFSTYLTLDLGEFALMEIHVNGAPVCCGYGDHTSNEGDVSSAACSAVIDVETGKFTFEMIFVNSPKCLVSF